MQGYIRILQRRADGMQLSIEFGGPVIVSMNDTPIPNYTEEAIAGLLLAVEQAVNSTGYHRVHISLDREKEVKR